MARKKKTLEQEKTETQEKAEAFTMPSEEPISSKKYLSAIDLSGIKLLTQDVHISKLKSENLALKIRNTEMTITDLQHQIDVLKSELRKSLEAEKAAKENARQNMVSIQSRYSIEGKFAYDPTSGELITE